MGPRIREDNGWEVGRGGVRFFTSLRYVQNDILTGERSARNDMWVVLGGRFAGSRTGKAPYRMVVSGWEGWGGIPGISSESAGEGTWRMVAQ